LTDTKNEPIQFLFNNESKIILKGENLKLDVPNGMVMTLGRKTINHPLLSLHQVELWSSEFPSLGINVLPLGKNPLFAIKKGKLQKLERHKTYFLEVGDTFTLVTRHFPLKIITENYLEVVPKKRKIESTEDTLPPKKKAKKNKELDDEDFEYRPDPNDEDSIDGQQDFIVLHEKPLCKFGIGCYRKNPEHFAQFRHPWLDEK